MTITITTVSAGSATATSLPCSFDVVRAALEEPSARGNRSSVAPSASSSEERLAA